MERIGEYQVRRLIGEGGMGRVLEAEEKLSGRRVALKMMRPELADNLESRKLFLQEVRILAQLEHPNIVRSLTSFEHEGSIVLVLEHLDGETLASLLAREKTLPWERAAKITAQITAALEGAHGQDPSIIHRDIKPDNIMILSGDRVKVMDFGIARVLEGVSNTTQSTGTLQYMSPEQIDAGSVDARSDLYALGLLLYEMLTGAPPFSSRSPRELLNLQCTARPPRLNNTLSESLPDGLESLLLSLLAKKPAARPQSAERVKSLLSEFTGEDESTASAWIAPAPEPQVEPESEDESEASLQAKDEEIVDAILSEEEPSKDQLPAKHKPQGVAVRKNNAWRSMFIALVSFVVGGAALFVFDPMGMQHVERVENAKMSTPATVVPAPAPPLPVVIPVPQQVVNTNVSTTKFVPSSSVGGASHLAPDGQRLRLITGGEFLYGSRIGEGELDEQLNDPARRRDLGDYYMDETEVTVSSFRRCVRDGDCSRVNFIPHQDAINCNFNRAGAEDHPMNCVNSKGAQQFASWRSRIDTRMSYSIPTEEQWEKAARGVRGQIHPWADGSPHCGAPFTHCAAKESAPVKHDDHKLDSSVYGIQGTSGNVSEWTRKIDDRFSVVASDFTTRGGNWREPGVLRLADRSTTSASLPNQSGADIGFRCVGILR